MISAPILHRDLPPTAPGARGANHPVSCVVDTVLDTSTVKQYVDSTEVFSPALKDLYDGQPLPEEFRTCLFLEKQSEPLSDQQRATLLKFAKKVDKQYRTPNGKPPGMVAAMTFALDTKCLTWMFAYIGLNMPL